MKELEVNPFLLEENINQFFNSIPIPSYIWQKKSDDFILIDYNTAAEQITSGKIKDLVKRKASEVHKYRPEIVEAIKSSFQEKKSISIKSDYIEEATGQKRYNSLNIHHLPPDIIIVHIKDITDWVLSEDKLKNSEEKYKLLFERSPIPIVLTDLKGTIIDYNLATEHQFGYKREDLIGKNYLKLNLYSDTLISTLKNRLSQLKELKPIEPTEFEIYKKDGSKSWIINHMSLINLDNEPMVQSFIIDITERKIFEHKIKRKLENKKFISTISSRLISTADIDESLRLSLLEMGVLIGASRAYILLFNEEGSLEFYLQVWCAEGMEPQMIDLTKISQQTFPWLFDLGKRQELIWISS
ncbi:MAG: PAS domain-containing protein, partial [Candidatus Thorarchaeota archaeon]